MTWHLTTHADEQLAVADHATPFPASVAHTDAVVLRWIRRVFGFGLIGLAGWAVWFTNVDADVKSGPRNCGPGALRVLISGPSRNRGVVSAQACRSDATMGVLFCTILALLGLAILALGLLERLGRRRLPVGPGVVALRRWSVNWRPPYLQVDGDSFHIVIPRLFGNRRWTVPLRQVTIATVPRERQEQTELALEDVVFDEPQRVEMIATRYSYCIPNLQVFFGQPQRVPTVRRFPANPGLDFTPKETRSEKGVVLDGILLSAADEAEALASLKEAGLVIVTDVAQWSLDHRAHHRDAYEVQQITRDLHRILWINRIGYGVPVVLFIASQLIVKVEGKSTEGIGMTMGLSALLSFVGFHIYAWVTNRNRDDSTSAS
jgi:hypothetical protein